MSTAISASDNATAQTRSEEGSKSDDVAATPKPSNDIRYVPYGTEKESPYLPAIRHLISNDLSEPYSIYVYRYFLYQWPDLCFMALDPNANLIGVIICKLEPHRSGPLRGYIAMLATAHPYRGRGIASRLVHLSVSKMIAAGADEIALETEVDNVPSLRIYEKLGFLRMKRLHRYYLNGNTAFRLVLYLREGVPGMVADGYARDGEGLTEEDLVARQAKALRVEDAERDEVGVGASTAR